MVTKRWRHVAIPLAEVAQLGKGLPAYLAQRGIDTGGEYMALEEVKSGRVIFSQQQYVEG
jgi:hypothetical protein